MKSLPEFIVFDPVTNNKKDVPILTHESKNLSLPLTEEDHQDIQTLKAKFESEPTAAGLAAAQIGIAKKIIIFHANKQNTPPIIWINATYKGLDNGGFSEDYESSFSVKDAAGLVKRFNKIHYTGYDADGNQVKGVAKDFFARVIQHEIDHSNGVLFTDIATKVISREEYLKLYPSSRAE